LDGKENYYKEVIEDKEITFDDIGEEIFNYK